MLASRSGLRRWADTLGRAAGLDRLRCQGVAGGVRHIYRTVAGGVRPIYRTVAGGVRHIYRTVVLRQLVIASACALFVLGFAGTIVFAVASQGLRRPPSFVGVLIAIQEFGAVIGGPTAAPLVRRVGEGRLVGLGLLVAAAAAILEMPPLLAPVAVGVAAFGACVPWIVVGFTTLIQRRTPTALQGRVYSAADALVSTPQTISIAVGRR